MAEKKGRAAAKGEQPGVSVRISPELRQRAKVYAALNNKSLMAVVDEAVTEYLDAKKRKA
jgi:predicted HicB family RNase H-like nuclease